MIQILKIRLLLLLLFWIEQIRRTLKFEHSNFLIRRDFVTKFRNWLTITNHIPDSVFRDSNSNKSRPGFVLGHEFCHAFDDWGSRYDARGAWGQVDSQLRRIFHKHQNKYQNQNQKNREKKSFAESTEDSGPKIMVFGNGNGHDYD